MAKFRVSDPDTGNTLVMDGDSMPSEAEISQAFEATKRPESTSSLRQTYDWSVTPLAPKTSPQQRLMANSKQMMLAEDVSPSITPAELKSATLRRPAVQLGNGTQATVRSIGVGDNRGEWVIPTIVDENPVSNDEAISLWKSGKNEPIGGPFKTTQEADQYAEDFHNAEANRIKPSSKADKITAGIWGGVEDTAKFFTSPLGIATLGLGAFPKAIQRTVSLVFAAQMASATPELASQLGEEIGKPEQERDLEKITKLITAGVFNTGFTIAGALHGAVPHYAEARDVFNAPPSEQSSAEAGFFSTPNVTKENLPVPQPRIVPQPYVAPEEPSNQLGIIPEGGTVPLQRRQRVELNLPKRKEQNAVQKTGLTPKLSSVSIGDETEPNIIQTGTQDEQRISEEAIRNSEGNLRERKDKASSDWKKAVEIYNREKSEDSKGALLVATENLKPFSDKTVLGDLDSLGSSLRASSGGREITGTKVVEVGTRSSSERRRIGQQTGELTSDEQFRAQKTPLEGNVSTRQGESLPNDGGKTSSESDVNSTINKIIYALRISKTKGILQRQPKEAGATGGESVGVEQRQQGVEAAAPVTAQAQEKTPFIAGQKADATDVVPQQIASQLGLTYTPGFVDPSVPGLPRTWDFKLTDQPGREMFSVVVPEGSTPEQVSQAKSAKIQQLNELDPKSAPPAPPEPNLPAAQVADSKNVPVAVGAPTVSEQSTFTPRHKLQAEQDRPHDIIDSIQGEIGKINPALIREANPNWKPDRLAQHIFSDSGQAADKAADTLAAKGIYKGDAGQVDQLGQAINDAARSRRQWKLDFYKRQKETEAQIARDESFKRENTFVRKTTEPVPPDNLKKGDSWTLAGEKIRVVDVSHDENGVISGVELQGGEKFGDQTVNGTPNLRADRRTYRSGKQTPDLFEQPVKSTTEVPKLKPGEKSGTLLEVPADKSKAEAEIKSLQGKLPEIKRQIELAKNRSVEERTAAQTALDETQQRIAELERVTGRRPLTEPSKPVEQTPLLSVPESKPLELPKRKSESSLPRKPVNKPIQQDMISTELPSAPKVEPFSEGSKVHMKGPGGKWNNGTTKNGGDNLGIIPKAWTVLKETTDPKFPDERLFDIQNDQTKEIQRGIAIEQLQSAREKTEAEREAGKEKTIEDLRQELTGLLKANPRKIVSISDFIKDFKTKEQLREAIKREKESQPGFKAKADKLASALENLKSGFKSERGELSTFGLIPKIWDDAISTAQAIIRAGGTVADAIAAAVKYIRDNFKEQWDEEGATKELESVLAREQQAAVPPGTPEDTQPIREEKKQKTQYAGAKYIGDPNVVENMQAIENTLKQSYMDWDAPATPVNTDAAWRIIGQATNRDTSPDFALEVGRAGRLGIPNSELDTSRIAPAILARGISDYATKLALGGDDTMIRTVARIRTKYWGTITPDDLSSSAAGSALRGLQARDNVKMTLFKAIEGITKQKLEILGEKFGTEKLNELLSTLDDLRKLGIGEQEIIDLFTNTKIPADPGEPPSPGKPGRPPRGPKTIGQVLDEMTPETKEVSSILDRYERSQTEWLKNPAKVSIILQIIREAIKNGPTAKFQDEKDFVSRVSELFQEQTVPKEISDRLAFEVWKDKAARESAVTMKANEREATREQRNAEQLLDQWGREQTEWSKPEIQNRTKATVKEWLKKEIGDKLSEDQFRTSLSEELQSFDVPKRIADELAYQALNRKRTLDDARKTRELERAAAEQNGLADKTAGEILKDFQNKSSGVEWLKPDTSANRIREIIREALKLEKPDPTDPQRFEKSLFADDPAGFTIPLRDRLIDAGVTNRQVAFDLAREVFNQRTKNWANARVVAMKRASQSRNITSLIESIRTAPQELQSNWKWRTETAVRWFESNGLSRDQAEAASKAFWPQFEAAMVKAREREANRLMSKGDMKKLNDLLAAIRVGLTNPDQYWSDVLAKREGWKPLSRDQNQRLAELETKANDPAMSPTEIAAVNNQMMQVNRQAGIQQPKFLQQIAERYVSGMLSSIRTMTIQLGPTIMTLRDYPIMALADPQNALAMAKAIYRANKANLKTEFKYAWQNEAYGFHLGDMDLAHGELNRIWEQAEKEYATGTPPQKAWARTKQLFSIGRFVTRTLNTIDQTQMASAREWKLAYYSSIAFKEAGIPASRISNLVDAMMMARQEAFRRAKDAGLDDETARVRANNDMVQFIGEGSFTDVVTKTIGGAGGDSGEMARKIIKAAENDVYSMTGRKVHGLKEGDEGMLSNWFKINWGLEKMSELRSKGGWDSILGTALFGFVNIPWRTMRFFANTSGYGLLRYGIHTWRTNRGLDTYWKQSFANELQARARFREALAGGITTAVATAWASQYSTSNPEAGKDKFGLYITGSGPTERTLRDEWTKRGWKPYALNFVINGRIVPVPVTRVGEALMWPFMIPASMDTAAWKMREREINGNPVHNPLTLFATTMIGEHVAMSGQAGVFQTITQLAQGVQQGQGLFKPAAKLVGNTLSASFVPLKQALQSISDMFIGPLDNSSLGAVVANQFPILALPLQHPAVNRFGDSMYDRSWYGRLYQTGIPIAFQVSLTPDNMKMYPMLVEKGAAAPELRRSLVEEKYGDLTDEQFSQFAKISGKSLKSSVVDNFSSLKSQPSDAVKSFLADAAHQADTEAASKLGLEHVQQPTGASRGQSVPSSGGGASPGLPAASIAPASGRSVAPSISRGASAGLPRSIRSARGFLRTRLTLPKRRPIGMARRRLRIGTSRYASTVKPRRMKIV